jgi:hypothetical protein
MGNIMWNIVVSHNIVMDLNNVMSVFHERVDLSVFRSMSVVGFSWTSFKVKMGFVRRI